MQRVLHGVVRSTTTGAPTEVSALVRNAHGRAAPFRRNDELLNLLPKGVLAFPGSGITDNFVDKAVKLGIPVARCAA